MTNTQLIILQHLVKTVVKIRPRAPESSNSAAIAAGVSVVAIVVIVVIVIVVVMVIKRRQVTKGPDPSDDYLDAVDVAYNVSNASSGNVNVGYNGSTASFNRSISQNSYAASDISSRSRHPLPDPDTNETSYIPTHDSDDSGRYDRIHHDHL